MQVEELPRLADFAQWVTAAESSLGWQPHTFLDTFFENQGSATSIVVESSLLAQAIIRLMHDRQEWEGYTQKLLGVLQQDEALVNSKQMPGNARVLSGQLQRIAGAMRKQGIDIQQLKRNKNGVPIKIINTEPRNNDPNDSGTNSSGVAKSSPGVANLEGKRGFATSHIDASGANSSEKGQNDVASVAKSSLLSRKEVEEREERQIE